MGWTHSLLYLERRRGKSADGLDISDAQLQRIVQVSLQKLGLLTKSTNVRLPMSVRKGSGSALCANHVCTRQTASPMASVALTKLITQCGSQAQRERWRASLLQNCTGDWPLERVIAARFFTADASNKK